MGGLSGVSGGLIRIFQLPLQTGLANFLCLFQTFTDLGRKVVPLQGFVGPLDEGKGICQAFFVRQCAVPVLPVPKSLSEHFGHYSRP